MVLEIVLRGLWPFLIIWWALWMIRRRGVHGVHQHIWSLRSISVSQRVLVEWLLRFWRCFLQVCFGFISKVPRLFWRQEISLGLVALNLLFSLLLLKNELLSGFHMLEIILLLPEAFGLLNLPIWAPTFEFRRPLFWVRIHRFSLIIKLIFEITYGLVVSYRLFRLWQLLTFLQYFLWFLESTSTACLYRSVLMVELSILLVTEMDHFVEICVGFLHNLSFVWSWVIYWINFYSS